MNLGIDTESLIETAISAAQNAGKLIMEKYHALKYFPDLESTELLSEEADVEAHQLIYDELSVTGLPVISEEGTLVNFDTRRQWKNLWLVDPLDGTSEFAQKNDEFTVSIALIRLGHPVAGIVYLPCTEVLYYTLHEKGIFKKKNGRITQLEVLPEKKKIEDLRKKKHLTAVVSRSHFTNETQFYIDQFPNVTVIPKGSAIKFMMLLEGEVDFYPRLGPTREWDTAASHAILNASSRGIYHINLKSELIYNKPDIYNPFFVAF